MQHTSPAAQRISTMIGASLLVLPPQFVTALDRILANERTMDTPAAASASESCGCARRTAFPQPASVISLAPIRGHDNTPLRRRQLQGLGAILEILHAAQLERGEGVDEPIIGETLIEGLMVAGRVIVEAAEKE